MNSQGKSKSSVTIAKTILSKKVWEKKKVPKISLLFRPGEFEKFHQFFFKN